jgi:hypothetical protein
MEDLLKRFNDFAAKFIDYETEVGEASLNLRIQAYKAVEQGKKVLETTQGRISELSDMISSCASIGNLTAEMQERVIQAMVSIRPRLETALEELVGLLDNPPVESAYPNMTEVAMGQFEDGDEGDYAFQEDNGDSSTESASDDTDP